MISEVGFAVFTTINLLGVKVRVVCETHLERCRQVGVGLVFASVLLLGYYGKPEAQVDFEGFMSQCWFLSGRYSV